MKSPAASSGRSSPVCWPQRAFARCRGPPMISAPGNCVARAQTQVWRAHAPGLRDARSTLSNRRWRFIRTTRRPEACWRFACSFAAHMGWVDRGDALLAGRQHAVRAMALDDGDSWGQIALRLSGHDGKAHRGIDRGLSARGQTQSEFGGGPWRSRSRPGVCRDGDREAIEHAEEAIRLSPLDPDMAHVSSAASRSRTIVPADTRKLSEYSEQLLRSAPGLSRRRSDCAAPASRRPGGLRRPGNFSQPVRLEQPQLSIDWIRASVPYQTPESDGAVPGRHAKGGIDRD